MVRLFVALVVVDLAMMVATLAMLGRLAPFVRAPGMGRILFFGLLTLQLFVAGVLGWFVAVTAFPDLPFRAIRDRVYFGLVIYLGVQAASMLVALVRWRRRGR